MPPCAGALYCGSAGKPLTRPRSMTDWRGGRLLRGRSMDTRSRMDSFGAFDDLTTRAGKARIARLSCIAERGIGAVDRLPFSRKVLLECAVRSLDGFLFNEQHVRALAQPDPKQAG